MPIFILECTFCWNLDTNIFHLMYWIYFISHVSLRWLNYIKCVFDIRWFWCFNHYGWCKDSHTNNSRCVMSLINHPSLSYIWAFNWYCQQLFIRIFHQWFLIGKQSMNFSFGIIWYNCFDNIVSVCQTLS